MSTTLEVNFGALAPALLDQVREQGFDLPEFSADGLQACATAIVRLHLREILSDSEVKRARSRLMKQISAAVVHAAQETSE